MYAVEFNCGENLWRIAPGGLDRVNISRRAVRLLRLRLLRFIHKRLGVGKCTHQCKGGIQVCLIRRVRRALPSRMLELWPRNMLVGLRLIEIVGD